MRILHMLLLIATMALPAPLSQSVGDITAVSQPPLALPQVEAAAPAVHWKEGLAAWKKGDYPLAAAHFTAMAEREHMVEAEAAAAFWAWRAFHQAGAEAQGLVYLEQAASRERSFYGILARYALGKTPSDNASAVYSIPRWTPAGGFRIDPALLFAFAKQESNFHADAVGAGGSMGLMQLMPSTARKMGDEAQIGADLDAALGEPRTNLQLGQAYLRRLLKLQGIGGNLIYLAAAYNAGPGKLAQWKNTDTAADPLLFLEKLPNPRTRVYVMHVLANYWMYQETYGRPASSALALVENRWPGYDAAGWQVAEASHAE